jgi:hypothetical protein
MKVSEEDLARVSGACEYDAYGQRTLKAWRDVLAELLALRAVADAAGDVYHATASTVYEYRAALADALRKAGR